MVCTHMYRVIPNIIHGSSYAHLEHIASSYCINLVNNGLRLITLLIGLYWCNRWNTQAWVPAEHQRLYHGRKYDCTHNVMAVCDFDMLMSLKYCIIEPLNLHSLSLWFFYFLIFLANFDVLVFYKNIEIKW
jgi:hypothetical protein